MNNQSIPDLGAIGKPQEFPTVLALLLAEPPVPGQPAMAITARMLVDAIRQVVREELNRTGGPDAT